MEDHVARTLKLSFITLLVGLFLLIPKSVLATDYYVAGDTGLDTNVGTSSLPWKTIQKAADTMIAGDTVNVKGGLTYSIGKNDCGFYGFFGATVCLTRSGTTGNYITYQSWAGTGIPIIQPSGGYSSFGFLLATSATAINYTKISGFLIKNADSAMNFGGIGNVIINNTIVNSSGVAIKMGVSESDTLLIYNNTLYGNTSGIGIFYGQATIKNNIVSNSVNLGIYNNQGPWEQIDLDYNNVYGSTQANYSIGLLSIGDHSLSVDPKFVDPLSDNFQLQESSSLIDAGLIIGDVTKDIAGVSRPQGNAYDIGSFESNYSQTNPPNANQVSNYTTPTNSLTQLAIYTGEPELTDGNAQFAFWNSFSTMAMGDVNGDGYDDFVTGARHYNPTGGMYVFYGKSTLLDTSAANADVIYRSDTVGHGFAENMSIGDLDNDGSNEILVTNYGVSKGYIFDVPLSSGTVTSAKSTITGNNEFGFGSTILGDINGDGYQDYAIRDNGSPSKIYVFIGDGTIINKTTTDANFTIATGANVVMLSRQGDINKDGLNDIVFGCPGWCGTSKVYVFLGKRAGWISKDYTQADIIYSSVSGNSVGSWVDMADVNGDGYDDILSSGSESIDVFYGGANLINKTSDQADVIVSASTQFPNDTTIGKSVVGADMNNDEIKDVVFSSSVGPKTYVVYGGPNLVSKNASQADLVFDAISAWGSYYGGPMETGDMNNDGYADIGVGAGMYNIRQGRAYILTSPHGTPVVSLNNIGNTNNLTISGTVTDTLTVGGVEVSTDNGSWNTCTVTSGNFTCNLSFSLSDGSHSLRLRSKNSLGVYMATREYTSASFTFDHTSPKVDWTDTAGSSKKYESQGGDNVFTKDTLSTFTFSKSSDSTSGLSHYEIIVDDKTYITNIDPNKPSDKDYREDDDKYVKYDGDNISVHAKRDSDRLVSGKAYKWKVRAVDSAGNSTDTAEKILRINTHEANFSDTWFPLSLLTIGGKSTDITSIHPDQVPASFSTLSTTPTFYGIAPVGTKVTLKIEKDNDTKSGRDLILNTTSQANESSRFGINVTDKLEKREYFIALSATNFQGDYVEIPEFTLKVGSNGTSTIAKSLTNSFTTIQSVLESKDKELSPVTTPLPKPTGPPQASNKHCFLWWCW